MTLSKPYPASEQAQRWQFPDFGPAVNGDYVGARASMSGLQPDQGAGEQSPQQAYQQGFERGVADGQQFIQQQVAQLEALLTGLTQPLAEIANESQRDILALSMATAKMILGRELSESADDLQPLVVDAISALPETDEAVQVYLSSHDADLLRERKNSVVNQGVDALIEQISENCLAAVGST